MCLELNPHRLTFHVMRESKTKSLNEEVDLGDEFTLQKPQSLSV